MFTHTTKTTPLAMLALATLGATASAQGGLEGHFAPGRWDDTGISQGITEITEIVELYYDVVDPNPADGVSFRTCQFTTVAESSGTIRLFWDARFRHSSWEREFVLQAVVDGPNGPQFIPLVLSYDPAEPTISPNFHGIVDLPVNQGYGYGFQMGGSHYTYDPNMNGNLVFWAADSSTAPLQNDPTQWTMTTILDGTTGARPALRLEYDVQTPSGGVPHRTTDLTALPGFDGTTTFDWTFEGDSAYYQAEAELSLITNGAGGETVTPLASQATSGPFVLRGRTSATFESGHEVGLRVGGGNFDGLNFIRGNLILSRVDVDETEACIADYNDDGVLDIFDVIAFLNVFSSGCP
ncbi:MAG: hypothetical protein KDA28_13140 [Phycisphaerales bacterium]|nr:hypothetical protein [Phycisphaerales bacterium]